MTIYIYALRDRMLDYFLDPIVAKDDHAVLASLSNHISGENNDAVAQAPHHFELWKLGQVQEDGHLEKQREFITDVSALIRPRRQSAERRAEEAGGAAERSPTTPSQAGSTGAPKPPEPLQRGLAPTTGKPT